MQNLVSNLWPYDEVSLHHSSGFLEVHTPWLKAQVSSEVLPLHESKLLAKKLEDQSLSARDLPAINRLFKVLDAYPFSYVLPQATRRQDTHTLKDQAFLSLDVQEMLTHMLDHVAGLALLKNEVPLLLKELPRAHLEWDVEALIRFASVGGGVDPRSALSVVRRFHLLELQQNARSQAGLDALRDLDDEAFKTQMAKLLRQNHYITERCQKALTPAVRTAQNAGGLVDDFMHEERGHDKLLLRALSALSVEPTKVPVAKSTKALMDLLELSAHRNLLAFAMIVDAFERSNYQSCDPMAQVLIDRGFGHAAKYINAHMHINDHGEHENVAQGFLQHMDLCSPNYVREAIRLAECLTLIMCCQGQVSSA